MGTMSFQYKLLALFCLLLLQVRRSYAGSRCYYNRNYCSYSWSGWTSSGTSTSYQRSYCSSSSIYCRQGRAVSATRCPDKDYHDIVGDVETPITRSGRELFAERLTRNGNSAIKFSSEDARYMTARMISILDYTVNELPRGFSLVVMKGYQDKDKGNASFPLQYEGRGVLLTSIYQYSTQYDDSYLLCITYKAALSAGFDWLEYTGIAGENYIKAGVGNEECSKVLDIAFMIDTSGSLETSDFRRAREFVKTIVYGLTINSDGSGARVAALSYSKKVDLQFDLNDHYNKEKIVQEIDKLTYFGSGTYTHLGLRTLESKVFQTIYGARSIQEGVPRIAFILTDGRASLAFEQDAENLKDLDVNVYAIGIGDRIDTTELVQIASSPADQYVSTITDYDSISSIVSESMTKICNTQARIKAGQQTSGSCNRDVTQFYQLECQFLSSKIDVELVESEGRCSLYASDKVSNPSAYYSSSDVVRDESTTGSRRRCSLSLRNTNRAYIGVRGRTDRNNYKVIVWEQLFSKSDIEVDLPDGISIGSPVTTISTDFSDSYSFQYAIVSQQEYFSIHTSSGQITLIKAIDYSKKVYNLTIGAQERSDNCRRGRVNVIIKVSQVTNTHPPLFINPPSKITIPETTAISTEIFAFNIQDDDDGENGEFYVKIASQTGSYFEITQTGQLKVAHQLNASIHTEHLLQIKATDKGDPPRSSLHELLVIVLDVNERPVFIKSCTQHYYCELSLPESDLSNYNVPDGKFSAHDYDLGNNAILEYSVVSEGAPFDINSATGQLFATYSIDRESKDEYILSVLCRDKGNPSLTAGTRVKVIVTDINDETPYFSNSIFFFSVLETSPGGTVCGQVTAKDNDYGTNSQIYYKIDSNDVFTANERGQIILHGSLDREVISQHQIIVLAIDKGDQPLTGSAQVIITILDVNDNAPVFSTSDFVVNLLETTPINTQVIKVTATDKDLGSNAKITYSIHDGDFEGIFSVVSDTGQILLSSSVNAERVTSYNLTLRANDNGITALEAYANLFITILDANDNVPQFIREYSFSVFEDASVGYLIGQLSATDGDITSQTITYTIQDGTFRIEESSGKIFLNATLNYNSTSEYNLSVTAVDNGTPQLSGTAYVIISVFQVDAKILTFSESYFEISIPEDTAISTRIAQYVPKNADGSPFVTDFELSGVSLSFAINSQGIISTTEELDYETNTQYELHIIRSADMATVRLIINVTDVNDNIPVLSGYNNRYEISEDAAIGQELFIVTATDADSDILTNITFSLIIYPRIPTFVIDFLQGKVMVAASLDYESVKQYWLRIAVTDNGSPVSLWSYDYVVVIVLDINDNSPLFSPQTYVALVTEGITPPHLITTVYARDADSGSNAKITFSIHSESQAFSGCRLDYDSSSNVISITNRGGHLTYQHNGIDPLPSVLMAYLTDICNGPSSLPSNTITIDPDTGSLTTSIAFDYETYSVFLLKVIGTDNGVVEREGVGWVIIQVEDINDSPPVFNPNQALVSIPENTPPATTIYSISVTDADQLGLSVPQLTLTTSPSNLPFALVGQSVNLIGYIDADTGLTTVDISVVASDGNDLAYLIIRLSIENINDNSPVFVSSYRRNISEYATPGTTLFTCQAMDNDISLYGELEYSILSGNTDGTFSIDRVTGVVTTAKSLDYETHPSFMLTIKATDGGGLFATTDAAIYVINENDNPPELKPPFAITITDVSVITVLSLLVVDQDTTEPQVIFSVESEPFVFNGTHTFMVKATDSLNSALYSTASISVTITFPCTHVDFLLDEGTGAITMQTLCSVSLSVPAQITTHSDVTFQCNAISNSQLEYCWKYEGRSRGCNAALDDNTLILYDITAAQSGRYACQATNLAKRKLISFPETEISVHGKPDVTGPSNLTAIMGTAVTLRCEIISSLAYNSLWYHGDTLLQNDSRITLFDDTLEIAIVAAVDAGDYHCVVTNAAGTSTSTKGWINVCDCQEPFDGDFMFLVPRDVSENSLIGSVESAYQHYFNYRYYIIRSNVNDTFVISELDGRIYIIRSILGDITTVYSLTIYAEDITSIYSGETSVTITVEQRNFYAPKITNFINSISIPETISVGQTILTLITDDKDFGKDGEVSMTLTRSADASYFKVLSSEMDTWLLVTDDRFNATKKNQFSIRLVASDRGNPPLSSFYDLTVFIEDINSPPQFAASCALHSKCIYHVKEDTLVTSKVASVIAFDTDIGSNARLTYKIDTEKLPFDITNNGKLILTGKLDYETIIAYLFDVVALDEGNPPLHSKTRVTVNVLDVNDNPPIFLQDSYQFSVSESLPPLQPFGLITASDRDSGTNGMIEYHVDHVDLGFKFIFDNSGHLETLTAFDYEDRKVYNFSVLATDRGDPSLTVTTTVLVYVLDENDNTPVFSQSLYQSNVSECSSIGDEVVVLQATDADHGQTQLYYSIPLQSRLNEFAVDSTTGRISLFSSLDAESVVSYQFTVEVKDSSEITANKNVATVQIHILNCNDNPPTFVNHFYNFTILSSANSGHVIGHVYAPDNDNDETDVITYSILNGNINNVFTMGPTTGQLIVNNLTASFGRNYYVLNVQASDGGTPGPLYDQAQVIVNIIDVSNTLTEFFQTNLTISVSEITDPSTPLAKFDFKTAFQYFSTNHLTRLEIVSQENDTFTLDPTTGVIALNKELINSAIQVYILIIESEYNGRVVSVFITVNVADVNDHRPQFVPAGPYSTNIDENLPLTTVVFYANALDADRGENARITYSIAVNPSTHSDDYIIDPVTGELSIAKNLSSTTVPIYTIRIFATDHGTPSFTNSTSLQLKINDVDTFVPQFSSSLYNVSVSETTVDGSIILIVSATDRDANAIVLYRFVPGSLTAFKGNSLVITSTNFNVASDTGFVTFQGGLDFERNDRYEFQVATYNEGATQLASTATVLVYVTDVNDIPPQFNVSSYSATISESVPVGTPLVQLHAYDKDTSATLTFSLFFNTLSAPIEIDINTGVVSTNGEIDYERIRFFSATAIVFDGIFQDHITILFEIENINDHTPIFATKEFIGSLREDATPPLSIVSCVASDNDDDDFGELTYSITRGNFDNKFVITPFTGVLSLNKPLDFEERSKYILQITVTDGGNKSATATAIITIINVNDNPPQISGNLSYVITDDTQIKIAKLVAIDKDLSDGTVPYVSYTYLENSLRFDCRTDIYSFIIRIADINDVKARSDSEVFIQLKYPCEIVNFAVEEYTGIMSVYTLCDVELFPIDEGQLGGNVTLRAAAKGNTVWTYCWKFNGEIISCTGQTSYMHLYNLQTANEGKYSVEVTNTAGTLKSTLRSLRIFVPPTILPLKSATAVQGSSVTLACTVLSEKETDVTTVWYFEGNKLAFSQQTTKNGSFWTIHSVQFSDEGFYFCKVTIPGFSTEVISQSAKITIFRQNAVIDISLFLNTYSYVDFCYEYDINEILQTIGRATHYNPVLISDTPSGRLCHSTVCYPNPCLNGAQCIVQNNNEFSCNCLPGWTGRVCDSPINYCRDSPPCLFQGACIPLNTTINNFRCACTAGRTGLFCELFTDVCITDPCENSRCVPSLYTPFTCVTTTYVIQIKRDVDLSKLLFGSDQEWGLLSNDSVVYQLEIFLRYFIQNIQVPDEFVNKSNNRIFESTVPCNVLFAGSQGFTISFDLICPPDYPPLNTEEKTAICDQLLYSGYFEHCIPPDEKIAENIEPSSLSNVTFYMEDDTGTPLPADGIIPILTSETALAPNPGNPYYLIDVDKAPEPVTKDGPVDTTASSHAEEASGFPAWAGAVMAVALIFLLLIIIVAIILCVICCPFCVCCPGNRKKKLLVEKRYIISNMSASMSDMTMTSSLPHVQSDGLYDSVGPARRNSELAEIGEERMMWRDNENPYVCDLGENETLSELTNEEKSTQKVTRQKKISTVSATASSLADEAIQSTASLIKSEPQPGQKKISTVSMTTHNPLFGMKLNATKWNTDVEDRNGPKERAYDNQIYGVSSQKDKNMISMKEEFPAQSMDSTFLTEIEESETSYKQVIQDTTTLGVDEDADIMDPWYFGNMTRAEAEQQLLAHGKVGGYLIRNCNMTPGDVCQSILAANANNEQQKFHHLLVSLNNENQYYIRSLPDEKTSFSSLSELIAYYSVTEINFSGMSPPLMLTEPCPKNF